MEKSPPKQEGERNSGSRSTGFNGFEERPSRLARSSSSLGLWGQTLFKDRQSTNTLSSRTITMVPQRSMMPHTSLRDLHGTRLCFKIAHNQIFRTGANAIILINAIQMGIAADHKGGDWDATWAVCDHFFTAVFTVEMLIMMLALQGSYFKDTWNLLDFSIVILAIADTWVMPLASMDDSPIGALRVFRMTRLLRIVRMLHIFPELMTVVEGLVASMKSMIWIFALLIIVLYAAGICCVEVIGVEEDLYPGRNTNQDDINLAVVDSFNNYMFFGTVFRSMVSLLNVLLMAEWDIAVRPVFEKQKIMVLFFVAVAVICTFGLLNVIVGVVVERTTEAMNAHKDVKAAQKKKNQMQQAEHLGDLMFELDEDGSGLLTLDEVVMAATHPEFVEIFHNLDLPHEFTFQEMMLMIDSDADGCLSRNEFVSGFMRMIYNTDFQRDCMVRCVLGEIKQMNQAIITAVNKDVRQDIALLRKEVTAALALSANMPAPAQSSTGPSPIITSDVTVSEKAPNALPAALNPASLVGQWGTLTVGKEDPPGIQSTDAVTDVRAQSSGQVASAWEPLQVPAPASVNLRSTWEPLQAATIPVRLLANHPQFEAALDRSAFQSPEQRIIGFLPVLGSPARGDAYGLHAAVVGSHGVRERSRWSL